jgi:hypothetical protein
MIAGQMRRYLSERSPVLAVADDAHWLDRSPPDALAFAGSRLDAKRVKGRHDPDNLPAWTSVRGRP